MAQEARSVVEEVIRLDNYLGNETLGSDRHSKHVLTNSFQVYNKHVIVDLRAGWDKFYGDFCLLFLAKSASLICNIELVLK